MNLTDGTAARGDSVQTKTLTLQEYYGSSLVDALAAFDLDKNLKRAVVDYQCQYQAYQLNAMLRMPADVVQDETVIAEYPNTLWDYIKRALGMNYNKCMHTISEHILYPDVDVPESCWDSIRIYTQTDSAVWPGK